MAGNLQISAAGKTDVGRARDHNEDSFRLTPDNNLFILADGMGGHNAGEVASKLAALSLENCFVASFNEGIPEAFAAEQPQNTEAATRLVAAVKKANADVYEIATTREEHRDMGTTVVALHIGGDPAQAHIAHVGDSRCYRFRNGELEQLTVDHNLRSQAKQWKPDASEEELDLLPNNVILKAIGREKNVEVDLRSDDIESGDLFLLCSDGLSGLVTDADIASILRKSNGDLEAGCAALIDAANAAGGTDNVTAVLVRATRPG